MLKTRCVEMASGTLVCSSACWDLCAFCAKGTGPLLLFPLCSALDSTRPLLPAVPPTQLSSSKRESMAVASILDARRANKSYSVAFSLAIQEAASPLQCSLPEPCLCRGLQQPCRRRCAFQHAPGEVVWSAATSPCFFDFLLLEVQVSMYKLI